MKDIIERARLFATFAHCGQVRKYTGDPYVVHPIAVAAAVTCLTDSLEVVAAAYLHDTIEDTEVTYQHIADFFGTRVAGLVLELTDVYTHESHPTFNRALRKKLEAQRLSRVSDDAKLIKRCDIADNTKSIVDHDPDFAFVYLAEKAYLLRCMDGVP